MATKHVTPIGAKFSRWTVISEQFKAGSRNLYTVACRCECGVERDVLCANLALGVSRSCGCLQRERAGQVNRNDVRYFSSDDGRKPSPTFLSWSAAKARCHNPKAENYDRYGGRGIKMCDRWLNSYENFLADMCERPDGMTLDRYPDVNGDYEPGNCRWATASEQADNKRNVARYMHNGELKSAPQIAREVGMHPNILGGRLRDGWSMERAISQPVGKRVYPRVDKG